MNKRTIEDIAYIFRKAKEEGKPRPIVFLGAGASASAGIPLTGQIIKDILVKHSDMPAIQRLNEEEKKDYYTLMSALSAEQRRSLFHSYVTSEDVKINVTHIYLAQLLKEGYVDYILTVNFDDLALKACALFNFIPPVYDVSILKDFTTTTFQKESVTYLHGQHHGQWLLNAKGELDKVKTAVPKIFERICNGRTWIIVGYKGDDEILEEIAKLGSFENELYWIGYEKEVPSDNVKSKLLDIELMNTYWVSDYNADSFFLKLHSELGMHTPEFFNKPFTFLSNLIGKIVDIDVLASKDELYKIPNERLATSKKWISDAIEKYENRESLEKFRQAIIEDTIKGNYDNALFYLKEVNDGKYPGAKKELSDLFLDWGVTIHEKNEPDFSIENLEQAIEKYKTATEINPKNDSAFYNWGNALSDLAKIKNDSAIFEQICEKYKTATEINPKNDSAFYNWGNTLSDLAKIKNDPVIFEQVCEKYTKATEINSLDDSAFNNWGSALSELAKIKNDPIIFEQACEKYKTATEINPKNDPAFYNWGSALSHIAKEKGAPEVFEQAFEKYKTATEINPKDDSSFNNWGSSLADLAKIKNDPTIFEQAFKKFKFATEINNRNDHAFYNWGNALSGLAKIKNDLAIFEQAIEKYKFATEINSKDDSSLNNWGSSLADLAKIKNDSSFLERAIEKFKAAIEINPENDSSFNNWGSALFNLAKINNDPIYFERACEKYKIATEINPKDDSFFNNWGIALVNWAEIKNDLSISEQACEKFKIATEINPQNVSAFDSWGSLLSKFARINKDANLFNMAFEKYNIVVTTDPNNSTAFYNWAYALSHYSKLLNGKDRQDSIVSANTMAEKAFSLDGAAYNLSCSYALLGNKEKAIQYLKQSFDNNEVLPDYVLQDEDWTDFLNDKDFKKIIQSAKNKN